MCNCNRYIQKRRNPALSWVKTIATFALALVLVSFFVLVFRLAMGRG